MSGNSIGGKKTAATCKRLYGEDWFQKIGAMGGSKSRGGGFAYSKANGLTWHIEAGKRGGTISRRKPRWME